MRIDTQRFGTLRFNAENLLLFPNGLIGMETMRQWALIADPENPSVAWLQSASRGDRAIALISPRVFFKDYRVHVTRRDLAPLQLQPGAELFILATISGHVGKLTTNLRAPILLNLDRRLGCQVITEDDQPIRQELPLRSDVALSIDSAANRRAA